TVGDAKVRVYFPPESKPGRDSIDPIVEAVRNANQSVVFCLFSSTDQPLRDECFKAGDAGKMMFGLVNSISMPKDPTKKDAQTVAMVEIYNRSKEDRDVVSHELFKTGNQPQGFWWEVATLKPKEPDMTADMVDAGAAPKKKGFVPAV